MPRPSKYKREYQEIMIEHLSKGFSFESYAAKINVCRDTLYEWVKVHPEFSDAKKRGEAKSLLFWEQKFIENIQFPKTFNTTGWIFLMKNRFRWRDIPIPDAELMKPQDPAISELGIKIIEALKKWQDR